MCRVSEISAPESWEHCDGERDGPTPLQHLVKLMTPAADGELDTITQE